MKKCDVSDRGVKAAADAGLICSLQQEGVPLKETQVQCGELCRCTDSYLHAVQA